MPLPAPALGLVVHYGFVWAGGGRGTPLDAGRPCLIIDLASVSEPGLGGRPATRVTYLPLSHSPPSRGEAALPIPPRVAAHLGLTGERSWLYTSYAVEDDWPFDVARRPEVKERFDYGFIPPRLFDAVTADFARFLRRGGRALRR